MALIKVLRCSECTSPLKEGQSVCPKCGAVNKLVASEVDPLKMTNEMAQQYIDAFKQKAADNPKDTNALFAMGLFYLGLKNYELAQRNFKMAVDQQPTEPDMYYYYALSLFEGKSPKMIDTNRAEKIEEWLHTATNLQKKRKYLILQMILRQGAFVANGLQVHGETPDELFAKIQTMLPEADELTEIETHVKISDPKNVEYLQLLKGEKQAENRKREADLSYLESFRVSIPSDRDNELPENWHDAVQRLTDPQERLNFFDYMYEPQKPQKLDKPSYPIGNMIVRLIVMAVATVAVMVAVLLFEAKENWGVCEIKTHPQQTVQQEYNALYRDKKLSKAERNEIKEKLRADSIARAEKDSIFWADYKLVSYDIDENGQKQTINGSVVAEEHQGKVTGYFGVAKDWRIAVDVLVLLLPFIIFLLKTIVRFSRVSRQRREVANEERENQNKYEHALDIYHNRAKLLDMVDFCREFLSGSNEVIPFGDPVTQTLKNCGIFDEKEVPGKILFLNYFVQYRKDDPDKQWTNNPYDVLDRVYYVVAVPQRDRLIINYNYWDTYKNELEPCDTDSIFYRNINAIALRDTSIFIEMNGTTKEIFLGPYGKSLLEYQSTDKSNALTYSQHRTGNPREFVAAMNQLLGTFQKN